MKELFPFAVLYEDVGLGPISRLAFSPNGLLAIGSQGAEVWDLSGEHVPDEPFAFFPGPFLPPLAWSPDGSRLAVGQENGAAVYSIASEREVSAHTHDGKAEIVAWSSDGRRLASCSEYGQCHTWQAETGVTGTSHSFTLTPLFLLWLPDQRILTNPFQMDPKSSRWQVQVWKDEQGEIATLLDDGERRCDDYVRAAFAPGSELLFLGTKEGYLQTWQIERGANPVRTCVLPFHVKTISGLACSPDGTLLASGSQDGHVAVWSAQGDLLYHLGNRPSGDMGVCDIAWWRDLLAVAYDGGHIALYRVPQTTISHD